MTKLRWIVPFLFVACGDDNPVMPDAPGPTPDAPPSIDAMIDMPSTYTPPMARPFNLSTAGSDVMMSVTAGPGGSFYAAGASAVDTTAGTPRNLLVVRLLANGTLDTTFGGGDGIASTTVAFRGGNDEIDIATQADGKIVVSATVAAAVVNADDAADTDVALLRFEADGDLDPLFGVDGVQVQSLNTSFLDVATVRGRDGVRGLAIGPSDTIFISGYQRAEGLITGGSTPRIDTDFIVAKFSALGVLDLAYGGGDGKQHLDIYLTPTGPAHTNATPRGLFVNTDGSVVASGYASGTLTTDPQVVLYRLLANGDFDPGFATAGVFHDVVLARQTEIYNIAKHGNNIVTGGYGRNIGTINEWISLRFNATTGVRDTTWGGVNNGTVMFDPDPSEIVNSSNCRNAVALPGDKTLLIGSSGSGSPGQDAIFAVLDATGHLDTAYGTGLVKYQLGSNGVDQFWGVGVSGTTALIVGYKGAVTQTATDNDDAHFILLPME